MVAIEIPGTPVAFARAGSRGGQRYTPPKQAAYAQVVGVIARAAMARAKLAPFTGPVEVMYRATFAPPKCDPNRRGRKISKPDGDNLVKLFLDSLNGIVFIDDAQACPIYIDKVYGIPEGVVATIMPSDGVPA